MGFYCSGLHGRFKTCSRQRDVDSATALNEGPEENFSGELSQFDLVNQHRLIEQSGRISAVGRPVP